jgi:hypothetical protein
MVEDMVIAKSDLIRSIYIPTSISATNTDKSEGGKFCNATIIGPQVACLHNPHHHPSVALALGPLPSCNDGVISRAMLLACSKQRGNLPCYRSVVNGGGGNLPCHPRAKSNGGACTTSHAIIRMTHHAAVVEKPASLWLTSVWANIVSDSP